MKNKRAARTPRAEVIDPAAPASIVINTRFGGLARFCEAAAEAGRPYSTSTVWGWLKRGDIPPRQVPEIKAIAAAQKPVVRLRDGDFIRQSA